MQMKLTYKSDNNKQLRVYIDRKYDPTKTTLLRNNFVKAMRRRFVMLARLIRIAIVDKDVFGLTQKVIVNVDLPPSKAFSFTRSQDKVNAFMDWLRLLVAQNILEVSRKQQVGVGIEQAWTNLYIKTAYQKGVISARQDLIKAGYDIPAIPGDWAMQAVFDAPIHADRIGLLYTRVYSQLKGITDTMENQISQVLALGMASGSSPKEIAEALNQIILGTGESLKLTDALGRFIPAERRAEMLARTEIIRAHHQGKLQEMKNWEVEGVYVVAELATAKDGRVCEECASLEGKQYSLSEAEFLIPVHPMCRCTILPVKKKKKGV
jgi:SPP1 gp7 family putative phage head morphogenesis protein